MGRLHPHGEPGKAERGGKDGAGDVRLHDERHPPMEGQRQNHARSVQYDCDGGRRPTGDTTDCGSQVTIEGLEHRSMYRPERCKT